MGNNSQYVVDDEAFDYFHMPSSLAFTALTLENMYQRDVKDHEESFSEIVVGNCKTSQCVH